MASMKTNKETNTLLGILMTGKISNNMNKMEASDKIQ